jgi:N,N'-diacetyllegionaminate synthase
MSKTFIIAEVAQAHEGSLGIAHSYIDALADVGVDAVKFQTHIADAESSEFEQFRVKFSYEDSTRFDYWKRMEFTDSQWGELKSHCDQKGIEFISSPFSIAAVQLLETIGVKQYKIGSGEINNYLMLDQIARTGKPVILSSGMSDWKELESCIDFFRSYRNHLTLLQCTTAYPTTPEMWGLQIMNQMRTQFNLPIGFSDHSGDIYAGLAATSLGAEVLEFHAVFDQRMFGPDSRASITIDQIKMLVKGVRQIEKSLQADFGKSNADSFLSLKVLFGKSLALNKNMNAGELITINDLESKKPGNIGIPASEFQSVIGKKLLVDKLKWSFLEEKDFL